MIKNKILLISCITIFLFYFAGCENNKDIKKVDLNKREEIKVSSDDSSVIKIGLIPEQDIRKMSERYKPLAEYLGKKLNLRVILVYLDNYGEVCDKFINKQLDAAFFGSFSYALTHAKAKVEPLVRPEYQGTSTYRGLIIVRKDSHIRNIEDMKGKRLVLVHRATYAGYLYPLVYFRQHGVNNLEGYFSSVIFAGSHDKAIFAVLRGEADVAISKDLVYKRIIRENPDLEKKLMILYASGSVPSNALCVSKDFDSLLRDKIKNILLNLDKDKDAGSVLEALGGASRFIKTDDADYRYLYETIKALGIDLKAYPYFERADIGFKAN